MQTMLKARGAKHIGAFKLSSVDFFPLLCTFVDTLVNNVAISIMILENSMKPIYFRKDYRDMVLPCKSHFITADDEHIAHPTTTQCTLGPSLCGTVTIVLSCKFCNKLDEPVHQT